ncbi:MAG: hypothetical protein EPN82_02015 [Bacteroidetes bacterium]|nr:MAG: hypothetical protein EPN82_02015 [Bacteroidota bacterium]
MKYSKLLILTFSSFIIALLSSCSSDNPTNNTQQGKFEFLFDGNWWVYERYYIDSLGNRKSGNSYSDSTFIEGTEDILGKTAFKMKTVTEGSEDMENYCYTQGEQFFMYSDFVNQVLSSMLKNLPVELPISLDSIWVKIADYNSNTWLVKIDTVPSTEIAPGVSINGTFTVSGEKGITKNITVNSKTFNAQEFKLIFKFEGYISALPTVKQTFTITVHSWFDKKVGILLQTYDESKFTTPLMGTYTFEGFEKSLLRYNVKGKID